MIQVSFPDQTSADAGSMVQDLKTRLLNAGFPSDSISADSPNAQHMDLGTLLHFTLTVFESLALAKALVEVLTPFRSSVEVKGPNGSFFLKKGQIDVHVLEKMIDGIRNQG